ncbi:MAG TPA: tyrosine--tRNA ligase [candidate division Zixibacteria bacterium]|nr:tyrosine--tRNA ligase [candidate division Zixibacteria bacterium]
MDVIQDLEFRGLLYQVTDRDGLAARLSKGPLTLYNGFDPTADSLTIGNLVAILLLRRFQLAGNHPIGVVGGGTGLVGDPSGKNTERQLNESEVVEEWTAKVRGQLSRFLDFEVKSNPARIVNNYDWLSQLGTLEFLRDVGKHFPVNYMLAKDSVSSRLDAGISFTEFSYMIMQSYDYLWLSENMGCELQTGGSDQWGNITAGVDLIRRTRALSVYGLTCPLVTNADGSKLGKTVAGAIWLDEQLTTPYQFYQYWMNSNDEDVVPYLKIFTFLSHSEIDELAEEVKNKPWERVAHRTLAREATTLVHRKEAMIRAENISNALFYGKVSDLTAGEIEEGLHDVPSYVIEGDSSVKLVDLLAEAKISPSKRRAREDIANGAISVNDERCSDTEKVFVPADRLKGRYLVIRRGKSSYHLVKWNV